MNQKQENWDLIIENKTNLFDLWLLPRILKCIEIQNFKFNSPENIILLK
jgi:hypothetical protein